MKRRIILLSLVTVVILISNTSATANWIVDPGFDDPGTWINGTTYQGAGVWYNDGMLPSIDPLDANNHTALNSLETENRYMYQVVLFDQPGKIYSPAVSLDYYANPRTVAGSSNVFGLGITLLRTLPNMGDNLPDLYQLDFGFGAFPHPGGWYNHSPPYPDKDRHEYVGIMVRTIARNGHIDNASVTFDLVPVPLPPSLTLLGPLAMAFVFLRSYLLPRKKRA